MKKLDKPNWKQKEARSRRLRLTVLAAVLCLPLIAAAVYFISLIPVPSFGVSANGTTIQVRAGGDFQQALNRAQPGDTIMLEAGATFSGSYKLPIKRGSEFITIRSSAADAALAKSRRENCS